MIKVLEGRVREVNIKSLQKFPVAVKKNKKKQINCRMTEDWKKIVFQFFLFQKETVFNK